MRLYLPTTSFFACILIGVLLVTLAQVYAQSTAALRGMVVDPAGAVVAGANITVRNLATSEEWVAQTDSEGNYQVAALPVGTYRIEVRAPGFQTQIVEILSVEVAGSSVQDFQLEVGDISQAVTVTADSQAVERTTISVGHVVNRRMVQE